MTRTRILLASPVAFAAGLFLAHCSSSSTTITTTPPVDSGTDTSTTHADSGSSGSGSGTGGVQDAGSDTGSGTGTSDAAPFNYAAGDQDGSCVSPTDAGCTPGLVSCGTTASCELSTNQCCQVSGSPDAGGGDTCEAVGTACKGAVITCNEAADCTDNKICCLVVTSVAGAGSVSCQAAPTCPPGMGIASAQVCRSNNECKSGSCSTYSCAATTPPTIITSCDPPVGFLAEEKPCTKM